MPHEEDIRAAFRALADQAPRAESVLATITLPPAEPPSAPRGRRPMAFLAPVAAAAAVAAVIALAVGLGGRAGLGRELASSSMPWPGCTRPDSQCVPRYYLDIKGAIRDRITGAEVATIHLPAPFTTIQGIAGAANDRTFVLAGGAGSNGPVKLFLARFDPADHTVKVSALPIPEIPAASLLTGLALSTDGRRLATGVLAAPDRSISVLSVYSLAGGPPKVWQDPGTIGESLYDSSAISWSASGMLAINFQAPGSETVGVLLLNPASPGGGLLAHSRAVVLDSPSPHLGLAWDAMLTPDGTKLVAVLDGLAGPASSARPKPAIRDGKVVGFVLPRMRYEIEEFSARTGRPIRTLYRVTGRNPGVSETLEWTNWSGSVVVAGAPYRGRAGVLGVVSGDQFRAIPRGPRVYEDDITVAF
jgi:hypothetical protein